MNRGYQILKFAVIGICGLLFYGLITMVLWNWLVPSLFNGPRLTIFQAFGLLALAKLLTVGFWARPFHNNQARHAFWKKKLHDKLSTLDPEEREAFKQKLNEKWCRWQKEAESSSSTSND